MSGADIHTMRAAALHESRKYGKPGDAEQGWKWVLPTPRREHEGSEQRRDSDPAPFTPLALPSTEGTTPDAQT